MNYFFISYVPIGILSKNNLFLHCSLRQYLEDVSGRKKNITQLARHTATIRFYVEVSDLNVITMQIENSKLSFSRSASEP